MKKLLVMLSAVVLLLCGCAGNADTAVKINVTTLMGPTGMGMAKLSEIDNYTFNVVSTADAAVAAISSGSADIAAVPLNLASVLYKKTGGKVRLIALNTLGVLYILENGNTVNSISDLSGKTLYATGQAATPEYIINYILEKNGVENVKIEYKTEHSELAALAASGEVTLCMLPEPNVTATLAKNDKLRIALNLTDEWKKVSDTELVQGCIVANTDFLEKNAASVQSFLKNYKASVDFVNASPDEASEKIVEMGIIPQAALAKKAIPNCNITFIDGAEMTRLAKANLQTLFDAAPASVGGALPDDEFYYEGNS